ncbi:serine hydrolase domain-containing protein [Mesobacillus selenatarsenatis]|uniref:Beta-lactamase (Cephalosporinase) n=1 Tax=Mesobacillus selenatarsenatis (strain DSM 18680 / JCM 14380 / FERM P-15431 / SF-1) TaxID=1321606 RepID=A0A0A8X1R3_MESS1|nr:serine hydrolase domain-containing protein [Mesobacillus selenatarsenatis]GAM12952.1 beta-lactamase (Cephalosporinase) [Mesobacillus selenatarsenatis SF-1]
MKNKRLSIAIAAAVLGTGVMIPVSFAEGNQAPGASIEQREGKGGFKQVHPIFSWDKPGPLSPVLHKGSVRGAGMVQQPLDEIDGHMETMIADGVMPGAVAFVARRGHIVKQEAYGFAYRYEDDQFTESSEPIKMEEDTIFDLASISKIFTTTAAMILFDQGRFELDDKVSKHIPEFAANGKEDVTIRQLLTHTSGFTAWVPLYTKGSSREDRMNIVLEHPLKNEPGTTYTYSDLNMITLGLLIERLSGQRQDEFVKENITEPLGMAETMYNPPSSLKKRIAATEYQPWTNRGIVWGEVHDENAWSLDGVAGHAGVFSTAEDLAKLAHMYLNDGRYGSKVILKPETVDMIVENQIPQFPGDDHGLGWELAQGWFMDALSEGSSLGHTGYTGTSIVVNRNNGTIAILLTNRVHPSRSTVSTNVARRQLARQVADSIPVDIPDGSAWFSGYGDKLQRSMTAEVKLAKPAKLSFDTWHRIEAEADYGYLETSEDGEKWEQAAVFTGSSVEWDKAEVEIPAATKHIRFRYQTDSYTNGRGWYVDNIKLVTSDGKKVEPDFTGEDWQQRTY